MKNLRAELDKRRAQHLYRIRRVNEGPQQPEMLIDGRRVVSFCSNDYLGLANHRAVIEAFKRAADTYGVGAGAAHLIGGHARAHHALEEDLAEFTGRERALLFSTGYMANLGVAVALLRRGDTVFEDRLLSHARFIRYRHADVEHLDLQLTKRSSGEKLILTDGVFSMDGDLAPAPQLAATARKHQSWLMVDDAHGLGVCGESGRGMLEHYELSAKDVPVLMGTLGKAFGTFGAFVAGSDELIETLIQSARTYIYTTALPPAVAEATRASLRVVKHDGWRREKVNALIKRFRQGAEQLGLPLLGSHTPIQPVVIGEAARAIEISDAVLARDILVTAIRPPTVPKGTARLRVTFSASHTETHIDQLLEALDLLSPIQSQLTENAKGTHMHSRVPSPDC